MAPQIEKDELAAAWRALAGKREVEGWITIPLASEARCGLLAARHFPGNEEALLVGFSAIQLNRTRLFPRGHGFAVEEVDLQNRPDERVWIGLRRHAAGRSDFFALMANDVIAALCDSQSADQNILFSVFLARIVAWQDFMRRAGDGVLSVEEEIGLFGELDVLRSILAAGVAASTAIDAWQGPLDGLHDFAFGPAAIEVKTTISGRGFLATVGSLEQLDDQVVRPLFASAVRLAQRVHGRTLPEQIEEIRRTIAGEPSALNTFVTRVLHAGFLDATAERYQRRFCSDEIRFFRISDGFPRLTRANVPLEVRSVRYEIDFDALPVSLLSLPTILDEIGVSRSWS